MKFITIICLIILIPAILIADEINPNIVHSVPVLKNKISIDGVLSEGEWDNAFKAPLNYEVSPAINGKPAQKTTVYMTYDDENLYVAFRCYDNDPDSIRANLTDRERMFSDDWVSVHLDTFHDKRSYMIFGANPLGVQMDGIVTLENEDWNWDAIWDSAGAITADGWVVEMEIPFSQIRLQRSEGEQNWGFDAWRSYPRSSEYRFAVAPTDPNNNCEPCQMIEITGFDGIQPSNNIELNPTFAAVNTSSRQTPGDDFVNTSDKANLGLTAKWGITNNIVAAATLNPDFSQIEADSRQLDINSNFALYFAEKRPFFLEGNSFFSSPMINSFYSRSLREPAYGAKVAGKEGKHSFGLMYVEDDTTNIIIPGAEYSQSSTLPGASQTTVGRYQYDINDRYTVGAQFTNRTGEMDYHNGTYGVDGRFRITDVDTVTFQALGSSTQYASETIDNFGQQDDSFSGLAYRLEYVHFERDWYAVLNTSSYSEDFRADSGFLPQVNFRNHLGLLGYIWRPDEDQNWFSRIKLEVMYQVEETQAGENLMERADLFGLYTGPMQSVFAFRLFSADKTYLGKSFDVTYFGTYNSLKPFNYLKLELDTSFGTTIDYRNNRLADRFRLQPMVTVNLGSNLSVYLEHHFERLSDEGSEIYSANISQTTWRYLINRRTMLRATLQYVNYQYNPDMYISPIQEESKNLFTQFLFSYKINPRTVLFLGYSDDYLQDQQLDLYKADYTLFAKIGYAWQL